LVLVRPKDRWSIVFRFPAAGVEKLARSSWRLASPFGRWSISTLNVEMLQVIFSEQFHQPEVASRVASG
jgi:hypothetical protein